MRKQTIFLLWIPVFLLCLPISAKSADKQTFCNSYADTAVKQYDLGMQHNLPGIVPPAWSDNRSGHYIWCMQVSESFANSETTKRQVYLDKHIIQAPPANKEPRAKTVMTAVEVETLDVSALVKLSGMKQPAEYSGNDVIWIQKMVLGLRHSRNNSQDPFLPATEYFSGRGIKFIDEEISDNTGSGLIGDYFFSPVHYLAVNKGRYNSPIKYKLPAGIVVGLGYRNTIQDDWDLRKSQHDVEVFGVNASDRGPEYLPGGTFRKYCGGDLGAPAGNGWCWYESTGIGFNTWPDVNNLPRGTVVGLKHSTNQPNKKLKWQGVVFNPSDPNIIPPPGFARKSAGDLGAPAGQGYFWYEKITGE